MDANLRRAVERFEADPGDARAFEALEEHHFLHGEWPELVRLYERRLEAADLRGRPRGRRAPVLPPRAGARGALPAGRPGRRLVPGGRAARAALPGAAHPAPPHLRGARVLGPGAPDRRGRERAPDAALRARRLLHADGRDLAPPHGRRRSRASPTTSARSRRTRSTSRRCAASRASAPSAARPPRRPPPSSGSSSARAGRTARGRSGRAGAPLRRPARPAGARRRALPQRPHPGPALRGGARGALRGRGREARSGRSSSSSWSAASTSPPARRGVSRSPSRPDASSSRRLRNPAGARLWYGRALELAPHDDPVILLALAERRASRGQPRRPGALAGARGAGGARRDARSSVLLESAVLARRARRRREVRSTRCAGRCAGSPAMRRVLEALARAARAPRARRRAGRPARAAGRFGRGSAPGAPRSGAGSPRSAKGRARRRRGRAARLRAGPRCRPRRRGRARQPWLRLHGDAGRLDALRALLESARERASGRRALELVAAPRRAAARALRRRRGRARGLPGRARRGRRRAPRAPGPGAHRAPVRRRRGGDRRLRARGRRHDATAAASPSSCGSWCACASARRSPTRRCSGSSASPRWRPRTAACSSAAPASRSSSATTRSWLETLEQPRRARSRAASGRANRRRLAELHEKRGDTRARRRLLPRRPRRGSRRRRRAARAARPAGALGRLAELADARGQLAPLIEGEERIECLARARRAARACSATPTARSPWSSAWCTRPGRGPRPWPPSSGCSSRRRATKTSPPT